MQQPYKRGVTTLSNKRNKTQLMKAIVSQGKNSDQRCRRTFQHSIRGQDIFGEHVQFTFKGKRSFQTSFGGIVSILIKLIMAAYIAYELYVIISRKHPSSSEITSLNDFVTDPSAGHSESFNPFSKGFEVGIGLIKQNSNG